MADGIKPIAKSVYVCDDVISDPVSGKASSGKASLLNIWDRVSVPPDAQFPYELAKICVFVYWRGGHKQVRSRVDIVSATDQSMIRRTQDCVLNFHGRVDSVFAVYRIPKCVFPNPGRYVVEVYCEDEFVDDQVIEVH